MDIRTTSASNKDRFSRRGLVISALGDLSPAEVEIEVTQALAEAAHRVEARLNSTGFDNEIRAYEAGRGQQAVLEVILPDQITDPFEAALSHAFNDRDYSSPFEFPTEIPDLVAAALL